MDEDSDPKEKKSFLMKAQISNAIFTFQRLEKIYQFIGLLEVSLSEKVYSEEKNCVSAN